MRLSVPAGEQQPVAPLCPPGLREVPGQHEADQVPVLQSAGHSGMDMDRSLMF